MGAGIKGILVATVVSMVWMAAAAAAGSAAASVQYLGEFDGSGVLDTPVGIAIGSDGNLLILDATRRKVERFSPDGEHLSSFGAEGTGDGEISAALGIAAGPNGRVYVSDAGAARVIAFDLSGNFLGTAGWGVQDGASEFQVCTSGCQAGIGGSGPGQFYFPVGVAVNVDGTVHVADKNNGRVERLSAGLSYVDSFGSPGTGAGQLDDPEAIAIDADNNVYVAQGMANRVSKFSGTDGFLRAFGWGVLNGDAEFQNCVLTCQAGLPGAGDGQFEDVLGMAVERSTGQLFAADSTNDRVQVFSNSGAFQYKFGSHGSGPGQFDVPVGVAADCAGVIYVVDGLNARVQMFGEPGTRPCGSKQGGGGTDTSPGNVADVTAPVLTRLQLKPTVVRKPQRVKRKRTKIVAPTVSFSLTENARVRMLVERAAAGRRTGARCLRITRANRKKRRCTRYSAVVTYRQDGVSGSNRVSVRGLTKLRPGKYRLVATATDASGNASKPVAAGFKVSRR